MIIIAWLVNYSARQNFTYEPDHLKSKHEIHPVQLERQYIQKRHNLHNLSCQSTG